MHARFAITQIRARAVVRLESRRSVHVENDAVLLVPELHMYAVRPIEPLGSAGVTLLLGSRDIEQLPKSSSPALVTRPDLVAATRELVGAFSGPVRPIAGASGVMAVVQQLVAESSTVALARTTTAATPLLPLRDCLRLHLSESVPTATLADMSGLTESHFIRAFHHEFGLPPHAYHMRLRLAHACELLARGESVSTAAYDCGFADQSHLSRKFKEVYGVAPGTWPRIVGDRPARGRPVGRRGLPLALMPRTRVRPLHGEKWLR
jgi:AraC-like DNA-binding protein